MPELVVEPGDAGNEAVRLDGAYDRAGLRVDLVNLTIAILPDPERAFRPGHTGRPALRCRYCREHTAAVRVDLLNAIVRDLEQVPTIESGAFMRRHIECAHGL